MSTRRQIVCLANSRKLQGRCVAGREYSGGLVGSWVRPVSAREHQEVSEYERQYEDGSDPQVLDVIEVPLLEPRPHGCQEENWLLDPNEYWVRRGRLSLSELDPLAEHPASLWIDGHSTSAGRNDRVPIAAAETLPNSLSLIHVDSILLAVFKPGEAFGNPKRRVQARFRLGASDYALWVTDPIVETRFLARDDGNYPIGPSYLTISLGEAHEGYCYKLVAAIIPSPT